MENVTPTEFFLVIGLYSVFCGLVAHSLTWNHMYKKIQKLELEIAQRGEGLIWTSCGGCGGTLERWDSYCDYCGDGLGD